MINAFCSITSQDQHKCTQRSQHHLMCSIQMPWYWLKKTNKNKTSGPFLKHCKGHGRGKALGFVLPALLLVLCSSAIKPNFATLAAANCLSILSKSKTKLANEPNLSKNWSKHSHTLYSDKNTDVHQYCGRVLNASTHWTKTITYRQVYSSLLRLLGHKNQILRRIILPSLELIYIQIKIQRGNVNFIFQISIFLGPLWLSSHEFIDLWKINIDQSHVFISNLETRSCPKTILKSLFLNKIWHYLYFWYRYYLIKSPRK